MLYSRNSNVVTLLISRPFNIKNFASSSFLNCFNLSHFISYFHYIHIVIIWDIHTGNVLIVWTKADCCNTSSSFLNLESRLKTTINRTPNKDPRLGSDLTWCCKSSVSTYFKASYIIIMEQRIDSCLSSWLFNHFLASKELLLHRIWWPIKNNSSSSCHVN